MNSHDDPHADLKELLDEAAQWCRPQAPGWDDLLERLPPRSGARFPDASPAARRSSFSPRWLPHVVAAGLLIAAGVVFLGYRSHAPSVAVAPASVALEQPPVVLAEGCVVKPVGEAAFRVLEPRRVQLDRGDLYVEIDPGQDGVEPFVIETPAGEAQSVDTSCVVQSRPLIGRSLADGEVDRPEDIQEDSLVAKSISGTKFLTRVLVLAGMVQLVTSETSIEGHSGEVLAAEVPRAAQQQSQMRGVIPGLWALRQDDVREDLGLTEEQEKKLDEIGKVYTETVSKISAGYRDIQDIEQRRAKRRQIRDAIRALPEKVRQEAVAVLTAEQLDQVLRYQLARRSLTTWCSPLYVETLSITPEQKAALQRKCKEIDEQGQPWQVKMQQAKKEFQTVREQAAAEIFAMFTPEQLDKIKQETAKTSFIWSAQRPEITKQIGLTEEQAERVKQIAKDHSEAISKFYREIRNLTAEQRKEAYRQVQPKINQLAEKTKQQVKAVLTAEQIDQLLLNQARATVLWMVNRPEFLDKYGIAGKQKEEIQQRSKQIDEKTQTIQQAMREISDEFRKIQQRATSEALDLLTAEQIEKLKRMELTQTWPRAKAQPQQPQPLKESPQPE